jgi:hypothetical protein
VLKIGQLCNTSIAAAAAYCITNRLCCGGIHPLQLQNSECAVALNYVTHHAQYHLLSIGCQKLPWLPLLLLLLLLQCRLSCALHVC